jgi:glycosyltransferase involved in cell wall biosynthesis
MTTKPAIRLAIHDYGGYPFIFQLSQQLARRGHVVHHLVADGFRQPRIDKIANPEDRLEVVPVLLDEPIARSGISRVRQERRYGKLLGTQIARVKPDIVVSANTPLEVQAIALDASRSAGSAFLFWLQDLHSVAIRQLMGRRSRLVGRLVGARFERMERRLLRAADATVAISDDFRPVLEQWGVPSDRVDVIENWAEVAQPNDDTDGQAWKDANRLSGRAVVLYAGTLARKHNPALLLELARGLPDANVVVVAEGSGVDWLEANGSGQPNLHILPLQPPTAVGAMLSSADVLVVILESDASAFSAPSKVLSYLAAGRQILAAMPATNAAARTIVRANAGRVVDPTDYAEFVRAGSEMLVDPSELARAGAAGRAFAEKAFDIGRIADRFEAVAVNAIARKSSLGARSRIDTEDAFDGPREEGV